MEMTPTDQRPTEDERIAYKCGYRQCCRDNGIPYVGIKKPFADKNILAFHIEISDKMAEYLFPNHADGLAEHITDKLKEGYEKFKRGEETMLRARFYVDMEACGYDYRPIKWPIKYPYWCSSETLDEYILIAYVDSVEELKELWPEADKIDAEECNEITFTSRFPKPEWYEPKEKKDDSRTDYPSNN